jgi:hypothetical protein
MTAPRTTFRRRRATAATAVPPALADWFERWATWAVNHRGVRLPAAVAKIIERETT